MTTAQVSVIIPAFNAVATVEKTVRSVMSSTLPLDVWVVDDGSTDSTADVVESLRSKVEVDGGGSRLFVIRQANQGAYMARLNALKQIKTPWFGFVDADDTIELDMFEKMLAFAEKEQCDVVQCGVEGVDEAELGAWYVKLAEKFCPCRSGAGAENGYVLGARSEIEHLIVGEHLTKGQGSSFIWNKLYRNQYDFSRFVTFKRLTNFDDMILNFQCFEKVERMGFLSQKFYHYAATSGSATHSYGARQFDDFCACVRFRDALGIARLPWYWVNLRSGLITVLRSNLSLMEKCYWCYKLLGTFSL